MRLIHISYLISLIVHILVLLIFSYIQIDQSTKQQIFYAEVTMTTQEPSASPVNLPTNVKSKKAVIAKPEKQEARQEQLPPAKKPELPKIESQPDDAIPALAKGKTVNIVEESKLAKIEDPHTGSLQLPQEGNDRNNDDANIQPEGNQTYVGPVFMRQVIYSEYPSYPDWAERQGIETEVMLKFWVNAEGRVVDVELEKMSGYPRIDAIAKIALRKWRFDPLPIAVTDRKDQWGKIIYKFRLD